MRPAFFLGLPLVSEEEAPRSGGEGAVIVFLKNSLLSFLLRTKVSGYCTRLLFSPYIKVQARVTVSAPCFPPFVIRGESVAAGDERVYHIY